MARTRIPPASLPGVTLQQAGRLALLGICRSPLPVRAICNICNVSANLNNALPTRTGPGQYPSPSRPSESLITRPDRE